MGGQPGRQAEHDLVPGRSSDLSRWSIFGTICVLDDHARTYLPLYTNMQEEFRGISEQDLPMIDQQSQLHAANECRTHELAVACELSDAADQRAQAVATGHEHRGASLASIISSTSTDFAEPARRGDFRSELIRLLGQVRLAVPSLAQCWDDIVLLANRLSLLARVAWENSSGAESCIRVNADSSGGPERGFGRP